jgi:hypothetical protein
MLTIRVVHYQVSIIDINVANKQQLHYILTIINFLGLVTGCILL